MTTEFPIEIVNLRKAYGAFTAVDGLNLRIKRGSFTGLLGPNGAGKSTTLKVLTGLIKATSGEAYINGHEISKDPKAALTGVGTVVETPEFYLYLTPNETFDYIGEIFGMSEESIKSETARILSEVKMSQWADKSLGTFSKGMRQRISLGLALMNSPSVIILDEPTSGLDPRGMAEMREILKNIRNDRKDLTVLMSSHMMHEVTDLCDRIALINHGKLLAHDSIDRFIGSANTRTVVVKTVSVPSDELIARIAKLDNVSSAVRSGADIEVGFRGEREDEVALLHSIAAMGGDVYSVAESSNALENRYLELIKDSR